MILARTDDWQAGLQSPPFGPCPSVQKVPVFFREPGLPVNQCVLRKRHLMILYNGRNIREQLLPLRKGVLIPFRKIHVAAPLLYISFDQPGCGRHIAVPRPHGSVRMAVHAGTIQDGSNLWWDTKIIVGTRFPLWSLYRTGRMHSQREKKHG